MARLRLGVLISGRGSNLQALLDACADPAFPAEIALVLSNVADAFGLERARRAGVPTLVIDHREFGDRGPDARLAFEERVSAALEQAGINLVCLAGFMRVLTAGFVTRWRDRLINIHPALLPAFPGLHTHERALAAGVRWHGCSVHIVRTEVDSGPILVQAVVPVLNGDDADTLAARVLTEEHRIYPLAVRLIAEGRVTVEGNRARITDARLADTGGRCNPDG